MIAHAFRRSGRHVSAGLFALSAVLTFVVLVGAVESWFGWLAATDAPFDGFHLGNLLLALAAVVAALAARKQFGFPLLTLVALVAAWYLVTDALSNGGWWSAVVTLFFGLVLLSIGVGADRVHGFWVHVVAGVTIGGALLYFWHTGDLDWVLVALASLAYVAIATGLARSSYAVLGAFGAPRSRRRLRSSGSSRSPSLRRGGGPPEDRPSGAAALAYAVYGLVLMLLGLSADQRGAAAGARSSDEATSRSGRRAQRCARAAGAR